MAKYEYTATINNNSSGSLTFLHYCKGTDKNPSGRGTTTGALYHGKIEIQPTKSIAPNQSGTFKAKSSGKTIQGTVVYTMQTGEILWFYFHVPQINTRHDQSANASLVLTNTTNHAIGIYTVEDSGKIRAAFHSVDPTNAKKFSINNPKSPDGISFPSGADSGSYHQQGIQKTNKGEFAVSGSAKNTGYIYFTDSNKSVCHIECPSYKNSNNNNYNHCGGLQITDDILGVGYERLEDRSSGTSVVLFYNVSEVNTPVELTHLNIDRPLKDSTAGAVGLTKSNNGWLVLVANWGAKRLDFYECNTPDLIPGTASFSKMKNSWSKASNGLGAGSIDQNWEGYQNINLFTQKDGTYWFVAMHTKTSQANADWADLYSLEFVTNAATSEINPVVTKVANMHFHRNGAGPRFLYGSGYYYDEIQNNFEVFSIESKPSSAGKSNRCNEWS